MLRQDDEWDLLEDIEVNNFSPTDIEIISFILKNKNNLQKIEEYFLAISQPLTQKILTIGLNDGNTFFHIASQRTDLFNKIIELTPADVLNNILLLENRKGESVIFLAFSHHNSDSVKELTKIINLLRKTNKNTLSTAVRTITPHDFSIFTIALFKGEEYVRELLSRCDADSICELAKKNNILYFAIYLNLSTYLIIEILAFLKSDEETLLNILKKPIYPSNEFLSTFIAAGLPSYLIKQPHEVSYIKVLYNMIPTLKTDDESINRAGLDLLKNLPASLLIDATKRTPKGYMYIISILNPVFINEFIHKIDEINHEYADKIRYSSFRLNYNNLQKLLAKENNIIIGPRTPSFEFITSCIPYYHQSRELELKVKSSLVYDPPLLLYVYSYLNEYIFSQDITSIIIFYLANDNIIEKFHKKLSDLSVINNINIYDFLSELLPQEEMTDTCPAKITMDYLYSKKLMSFSNDNKSMIDDNIVPQQSALLSFSFFPHYLDGIKNEISQRIEVVTRASF